MQKEIENSDLSVSNTESIESVIKNNIKNILLKKYGEFDVSNIFDDIDNKDIEDNLQTAESTINTNEEKGYLDEEYSLMLPNLRDGLALSYAAANKGKKKAARLAKEAAYTERDKFV